MVNFDYEKLPPLREDLDIQLRREGGETFAQLYDPLRHRYYDLTAASTQMLRFWRLGQGEAVLSEVQKSNRAMSLTQTDLDVFQRFLTANNLVRLGSSTEFLKKQRQQASSFRARFGKLMFFRFDLGNPTRVLEWAYPFGALFYLRFFTILSLVALCVGGWIIASAPSVITEHLVSLGSLQGGLSLVLAAVIGKMVHELGHAFQALRLGIPVSRCGVMFMLAIPLPFTEITDAWRLPNRGERMRIAAGGILAELGLACWMILLFAFLPNGDLRTLVFSMATLSILLSLLVNLNPLMRFDGYHMLSDLTGFKNLQSRSNAMGRWYMRRVLFGLKDNMPEPLARDEATFLIGFAYGVWVYRLFLYLGIATLVYLFLPKVLGAPIAVTALILFVAIPIVTEVKVLARRATEMVRTLRAWFTALCCTALCAAAFVPYSKTHKVPARLVPHETVTLVAPRDAVVRALHFVPSELPIELTAGKALWSLEDPNLNFQIERATSEHERISRQLSRRSGSDLVLAQSTILAEQADLLKARIEEAQTAKAQLEIKVPFSGTVSEQASLIQIDMQLGAGTPLAQVSDFEKRLVQAIIPSDLRREMDTEADPKFVSLGRGIILHDLQVDTVEKSRVGPLEELEFLRSFGGEVAVSANESTTPQGVWHRLQTYPVLGADLPQIVLSGHLHIKSLPQSLAKRMITQIKIVAISEASF